MSVIRTTFDKQHAVLLAILLATAVGASPGEVVDEQVGSTAQVTPAKQTTPQAVAPSDRIADAIRDDDLQRLVREVLERNPRLASLRAVAAAARQKAPQVKSLPDPIVSATWFVMSPQTRVGPQNFNISLAQRFPWFGKLDLEEQAAVFDTASAEARVESLALELVTRTRTLYHELQYLHAEERVVGEDRETLTRFEELSRARYAAGTGLGQAVIKIQAEITRADTRLLAIEDRGIGLEAAINRIRDLRASTPVRLGTSPGVLAVDLDIDNLRVEAIANRPEVVEAAADIESSTARIDLASKKRNPDVFVGLTYGFVGKRNDDAGTVNPPQGNGNDILGLTGGVSIPLWSGALKAGEEEATQVKLAAEERKRAVIADIEAALGDLVRRTPLLEAQIALIDGVLIPQAEESLISVESAYASGTADALDLLDAERTLLDVRLGQERLLTDLAVILARLEGTIADPLTQINRNGSGS